MDNNLNSLYESIIIEGNNIAEQNCRGGYPDKNNCFWYHGYWMVLRYLGMVSNPFWHESFYCDAINKYNLYKSNILIAGTADFSMPFLCAKTGCENITVYDICKTPLCICERVSAKLGYSWKTKQQDICKCDDEKFSAVLNDAFISRFKDKQEVLNGISNSLIEGGYYITSLKKQSKTADDVIDQLKKEFVNQASTRFNQCKGLFPDFDIVSIAETYVKNMASYPIVDEKEAYSLFEECNFNILQFGVNNVQGEYEPSEYYQIIAQKKQV